MSEFVSVDSFLQELTSEGRLDSVGQFTLSLEHAREKLSHFLLRSSEEYLLKLVQAGVAAGATSLELRSSTARVSFLMRGVSFAPVDLYNILQHLLDQQSSPKARCLRHLATAVNTATTTRATGISLATWDGQRGERIFWKAGGRSRRPWRPTGSQPLFLFQLRRTALESASQFLHLLSQRDIFSMLLGSRSGLDPDRLMLLDRASWCPVPLSLNGQWLPRPRLGLPQALGPTREWLALQESHDPGVRGFREDVWGWPWSRHFGPAQAGVVMFGPRNPGDESLSQLHWVLDGVLVKSQLLAQVPQGQFAWAVYSAHGCSTDLTGLNPVEDEYLLDRSRAVRSRLRESFGINLPAKRSRRQLQTQSQALPVPPTDD